MKPLDLCAETSLLKNIDYTASPNQDERPIGTEVNLLVIHCISLPPKQFGGPYVEQLFVNQLDYDYHPYFKTISSLKVSSHLYIQRDGKVTQFVPFDKRAWHAGESIYDGVPKCNDYSIGIELEGDEETPYTEQQYKSLVACTVLLLKHYPKLNLDRIVGHSDIAPQRKTDPGPSFDWDYYKALIHEHPLKKVG